MVGMKGRSATWRVSHLFGGTEQVGKDRKQNYNPFGLKSNLRSVNVCFDGQETNQFPGNRTRTNSMHSKVFTEDSLQNQSVVWQGEREKCNPTLLSRNIEFSKQEKT